MFNYLIFLLLYFSFTILYNSDKEILKFIVYGLVVGLFIELTVGYGQLFGLVSNTDSKFIIGGLFGNPGAFSGYLAIVSSFLLAIVCFYSALFKSENFQYTIVFSLFCALGLLFLCDSRGAWVACLICIAYVLNKKYDLITTFGNLLKTKVSRIVASAVLMITIVIVSISLFN